MNIFVLSLIPYVAAMYHCDKHVVKMILEYAQLLSTAHRLLDGYQVIELTDKGRKMKRWKLDDSNMESVLYKSTHINHPCVKWLIKSNNNYMWLYELFTHLCDRYTHIYGKIHSTDTKLRILLNTIPKNIPNKPITPFPQAMPEDYKVQDDPVTAYRIYYCYDKINFATWKISNKPWWFNN